MKAFLLTAALLVVPSPLLAHDLSILVDLSDRMVEEEIYDGRAGVDIVVEELKGFLKRNRRLFDRITIAPYGADCERKGVVVKVRKKAIDRSLMALRRIGERKGGMLYCLKEAFSRLRWDGDVVLVIGGMEGCGRGLCTEVRSIAPPRVRVYTIGFAVTGVEEMEGLKCIASATGGRFFAAADIEGFRRAFREVEKRVAYNLEIIVYKSRDEKVMDYLRTRYGYAWWADVYRSGTDEKVASTHTFPARFHLPPGRYDLLIHYRDSERWLRGVEVKEGERTRRKVSFAKGMVVIRVFDGDEEVMGVKRVPRLQWWSDVFDVEGRKVETTETFPVEFNLITGRYDIRLHYMGKERWLKGVDVEEGKTLTFKVVFP